MSTCDHPGADRGALSRERRFSRVPGAPCSHPGEPVLPPGSTVLPPPLPGLLPICSRVGALLPDPGALLPTREKYPGALCSRLGEVALPAHMILDRPSV